MCEPIRVVVFSEDFIGNEENAQRDDGFNWSRENMNETECGKA